MMDQQASIGLRQKQIFLQSLEAEPNPTFFRSAMKRGSERPALILNEVKRFVEVDADQRLRGVPMLYRNPLFPTVST